MTNSIETQGGARSSFSLGPIRVRPVRILDILAPIFVSVITVVTSLRLEDVKFWDESLYLERGLSLSFGSQPSWEWNPLYTDMYWMLGRIFSDPIDLYFAGRATTAVTIVLAVWISLRLFTGPGIAITGALVMSALPITYVWPGVSSPSAGLLLLALAVVWRWRSLWAYVGATSLIWLAAATRPEFVWAALAASAVIAVAIVLAALRQRVRTGSALLLFFGLVGTPMILTIAYGNPFDLGTRSWEAFAQHYELRFANASDDPWQVDADIVGRDFPGATTVFAAAAANPAAFLLHTVRNVATLVKSAGGHALGLGGESRSQNVVGVLAAGLWVSVAGLAVFRAPPNSRGLLVRTWRTITARSSQVALLVTAMTSGFSLISILVIYPRPHYLVFLVAVCVVVLGYTIDKLVDDRVKRWLPITAITVVSSALVVSGFGTMLRGEGGTSVYASSLRSMNESTTNWILLTPERPIDIYLTNGQQIISPDRGYSSFAELLDTNNVNVIFDGILFRQADYSELEDFDDFVEDPQSFGFSPIIPGSPFLIRGDENSRS